MYVPMRLHKNRITKAWHGRHQIANLHHGQQTTKNKQTQTNHQQPTMSTGQPTVNSEQSATKHQRPTIDKQPQTMVTTHMQN